MTAGGSWLIAVAIFMFACGYTPRIVARIRGRR